MAAQSPGQHRELFARIEEGMAVYDRDGKRVGKVADCYPGGETLAELSALPADSPLSTMPSAHRSRLAREGFVEITAGLLGGIGTPPAARWPGWKAVACNSPSPGMRCSASDRSPTGRFPPAASARRALGVLAEPPDERAGSGRR